MGDRTNSRRKKKEVSDRGRSSSCRRCARKKKRLFTKMTLNPCNPLSYMLNRQIDDRFDYSKKLIGTRFSNAENLFRKDLYSHYGCVNAIEFSKEGHLLISGGDDKRVLLWKVEQALQEFGKPTVMKAQHMSNIFCLGYNCNNSKIFSAGNDDQVIVHDIQTTDVLNFFRHEKPVYGLSVHPHNENVFSSACDDGRVLIYDIRGAAGSAESFFCVAQHKSPFHAVRFNPADPKMLATANAKEGVSMWDVRKPMKPVLRYGSEGPAQSCMNVTFNEAGTTLLALRRRLPPVLYPVDSATHLCQFDHAGYYNSCTMKSCCFAGTNDEYILSGSDDFNLYMWKIPVDDSVKLVDSAHMVLRGHRSIVNQVRYNQASCILASSGVEKIIKLWSPFPLSQKCLGGLKREDDKEEKQRRVYTHDEYIGLVLRSNQFMTHDYSHQSTDEDQRMMAFFDSLVQREIESWSSEDIPTPQSEPDNNNVSDRNDATDSDDSTASEHQLMRCFFGSSLNSHNAANAPERPLESPNRITRLIANRRERLMRLAALENGSHSKNNSSISTVSGNTIAMPVDSASTDEVETRHTLRSSRSKTSTKMTLRSKGVKRKHSGRLSSRRSRARRKQSNAKDDSDSEPEHQTQNSGDAQPSTSTGVVSSSGSSRYRVISSFALSRHSSSDEGHNNNKVTMNGNTDKRRSVKTDSDSSVKEVPKRKATGRKNKTSAIANHSRRNNRVKSKRQKVNSEELNNHNESNRSHNGVTIKEPSVTPLKNKRRPITSDSGITSGVSAEKSNLSTAEKSRGNRAESSDRERSTKNHEILKKKVDVARRGYRKRVMLPSPSSSDSSDD